MYTFTVPRLVRPWRETVSMMDDKAKVEVICSQVDLFVSDRILCEERTSP